MRGDDGFVTNLGVSRALEVFVLAGHPDDLPRMQQLLTRVPLDADLLSAIARFGCVTSWAMLLHALADSDLADDAAHALEILFGPLVDERGGDVNNVRAWQQAIAARRLDPAVRLRRGAPWSPSTLATECRSGALSTYELEGRLDELTVRLGATIGADLRLWLSDTSTALEQALVHANNLGRTFAPGTWG